MRHAEWSMESLGKDTVLIADRGHNRGCLSVTNDAEFVVEQVAPFLSGRKLRYIDSSGDESELKVIGGRFAGFAP